MPQKKVVFFVDECSTYPHQATGCGRSFLRLVKRLAWAGAEAFVVGTGNCQEDWLRMDGCGLDKRGRRQDGSGQDDALRRPIAIFRAAHPNIFVLWLILLRIAIRESISWDAKTKGFPICLTFSVICALCSSSSMRKAA